MYEVVIGNMLLLCVAICRGALWLDALGLCLGDIKRLAPGWDVIAYG